MTKKTKTEFSQKSKDGFTLIEVMLVLGITGLILVGLLGGTFSSIAHQRYNDAYRNLDEYLSRKYSEVLSPETLGAGNSKDEVILGKVLTISRDDPKNIYSATLIGDAQKANTTNVITGNFITDLARANARLACDKRNADGSEAISTMEQYTMLWQAELKSELTEERRNFENFQGTIIIARTPSASTVHTVYSQKYYDLKENCEPGQTNASSTLTADLSDQSKSQGTPDDYFKFKTINVCVKSDDTSVVRAIRIAEDGRNTSAVTTLTEEESPCK